MERRTIAQRDRDRAVEQARRHDCGQRRRDRAAEVDDAYDWYGRHQRVLAEQGAAEPDIVMIGDSITHFWAGLSSIGGDDARDADHERVWTQQGWNVIVIWECGLKGAERENTLAQVGRWLEDENTPLREVRDF